MINIWVKFEEVREKQASLFYLEKGKMELEREAFFTGKVQIKAQNQLSGTSSLWGRRQELAILLPKH